MTVLPPGTILQRLYVRERLAGRAAGTFIEIGPGEGHLSRLLLDRGWRGVGIEADAESAARASAGNRTFIDAGRYAVLNDDWLAPREPAGMPAGVDLVVSCMVLEHLDEAGELRYLQRCREQLAADGMAIVLVPGSEAAWGIEDEIAGHFRRYTRERLAALFGKAGWKVQHVAGLTFPVSNLLLPVSNWLVRRAEAGKAKLSMSERTASSGRREVAGKTVFPPVAGLVLNEVTLYPLHLVQRAFRDAESALVLYAEARP